MIRVTPREMFRRGGAGCRRTRLAALRRSIAQVAEYQSHVMPKDPAAAAAAGC